MRDELFSLSAPFDQQPESLIKTEMRIVSANFTESGFALINSGMYGVRHERLWYVDLNDDNKARILIDRSREDRYDDPGSPNYTVSDSGKDLVATIPNKHAMYMFSVGSTPEGNKPFLSEFDLQTCESKILWRCEFPYYEWALEVLPGNRIITTQQTIDSPQNFFFRNLDTGEIRRLTNFPHPYPQIAGSQKEFIKYTRDDGVELSGTLYLPPGYNKEVDGPLPLLIWAYPIEYRSASAASQVVGSPYRFPPINKLSPLLLLTQGYAVLYNAAMPVVGEGDAKPNDTFIKQIVANAKAAIDKIVGMGLADPERIAIGGHSYGAFMTVNLLAHSDLFAAGIARSGAYNRTLTPFGFQSEDRNYWEAKQVYNDVSLFMYAENIKEPLLLIHGEDDNNAGTQPIQSISLFQALKGLGSTVRLVMLPYESHTYISKESIMHTMWEMVTWLDTYVKNKK